jgi:hypothetical protein
LEDWLIALQKMDLISLEVRVMDSVRLDQTMVATVDAQWKLRFMGHAIDERVLLTDVWVKIDGNGRLSAAIRAPSRQE